MGKNARLKRQKKIRAKGGLRHKSTKTPAIIWHEVEVEAVIYGAKPSKAIEEKLLSSATKLKAVPWSHVWQVVLKQGNAKVLAISLPCIQKGRFNTHSAFIYLSGQKTAFTESLSVLHQIVNKAILSRGKFGCHSDKDLGVLPGAGSLAKDLEESFVVVEPVKDVLVLG